VPSAPAPGHVIVRWERRVICVQQPPHTSFNRPRRLFGVENGRLLHSQSLPLPSVSQPWTLKYSGKLRQEAPTPSSRKLHDKHSSAQHTGAVASWHGGSVEATRRGCALNWSVKLQTRVVSGLRPDIKLLRLGPHRAYWTCVHGGTASAASSAGAVRGAATAGAAEEASGGGGLQVLT
jgi:hypothetical protein